MVSSNFIRSHLDDGESEIGWQISPHSRGKVFKVWRSANLKSNQSWEKIIILFSSDDIKAFDKFFVLFEEFVNRDKILENEKNEV
ncbi:hypothetical protein [Nostoc sp.]|uniref:hypothetical protein n=1 Tax=Nostoc sp. TaxID=1180 RepID=UPI002FF4A279